MERAGSFGSMPGFTKSTEAIVLGLSNATALCRMGSRPPGLITNCAENKRAGGMPRALENALWLPQL